MASTRKKDVVWRTPFLEDGVSVSNSDAHLSVLMDIRDELKSLNAHLRCPNLVDMPRKLERIARSAARIKSIVEAK